MPVFVSGVGKDIAAEAIRDNYYSGGSIAASGACAP